MMAAEPSLSSEEQAKISAAKQMRLISAQYSRIFQPLLGYWRRRLDENDLEQANL